MSHILVTASPHSGCRGYDRRSACILCAERKIPDEISIIQRDCVLCKVRAEDEGRAEHLTSNTTQRNHMTTPRYVNLTLCLF
jgi:hypothetical protein